MGDSQSFDSAGGAVRIGPKNANFFVMKSASSEDQLFELYRKYDLYQTLAC